jgi:hypothetical protein
MLLELIEHLKSESFVLRISHLPSLYIPQQHKAMTDFPANLWSVSVQWRFLYNLTLREDITLIFPLMFFPWQLLWENVVFGVQQASGVNDMENQKEKKKKNKPRFLTQSAS